MIKLSICIPTFNRENYLFNCLNSILIASHKSNFLFEVCISDNCSFKDINYLIKKFNKKLNIVFNKNKHNIGLGNNILKSVSLAKGEFVWILGNDDLILPHAFNFLDELFKKNQCVDFYYINSFHISNNVINSFKTPFDVNNLDTRNLEKFSKYQKSGKQNFFELINPLKSFEFMLSMYLCIFRRKIWKKNLNIINKKNISDTKLYSNFDNTAPHIKIWAKGFKNKKAYFLHKPLSANVHGPRSDDWGDLYSFVEAVRIPQVLDFYRKNGMSFFRYFICKNFALRRFLPSFYNMLFKKNHRGLEFVNFRKDVMRNLLYPGIYIFGIYFFIRRLLILVKNFF